MNVVAVASARGGESGHRLPSGPARRIVRPRAHKTDVEQIEQLDDTTVRWNVSVMGADRTFEAEITEQEPDKRLEEPRRHQSRGRRDLPPHRRRQTRVNPQMDVEPTDWVEKAADALGPWHGEVKQDPTS